MRRLLVLVLALGALSAAPAHASTWCGVETSTNLPFALYGGPDVHVVYAHPSDQPDRFSQFANAIETDAEHIDAWWRGQDPTRAPRFDLYPFSCGPQLDVSSIKLSQPGAALTDTNVLWDRLVLALRTRGLMGRDTAALVYYDGPSDPHFCGVGGTTTDDGSGLGIVLMSSCPNQRSERVAARELGGAFGGVPAQAPHRCPDQNATCDDPSDLMVYEIPEGPLSDAVLDPGRDDYYGHAAGWPDMRDSRFLSHLDAQELLSVAIAGRGRVASNLPGIGCSKSCASFFDGGTSLTLRAKPARGRRFVRWGGACRGHGACVLTIGGATHVNALFAPRTYRLTVSVTGRGRVVSAPRGISCRGSCRHAFTSYRTVRLVATPATGWRLSRWTGSCRGRSLVCSLPMRSASSARAIFVRRG